MPRPFRTRRPTPNPRAPPIGIARRVRPAGRSSTRRDPRARPTVAVDHAFTPRPPRPMLSAVPRWSTSRTLRLAAVARPAASPDRRHGRHRSARHPTRLGEPRRPGTGGVPGQREPWVLVHACPAGASIGATLAARGGLRDGATIRYRGRLHRLRVVPSSRASGEPLVAVNSGADEDELTSIWPHRTGARQRQSWRRGSSPARGQSPAATSP